MAYVNALENRMVCHAVPIDAYVRNYGFEVERSVFGHMLGRLLLDLTNNCSIWVVHWLFSTCIKAVTVLSLIGFHKSVTQWSQ